MNWVQMLKAASSAVSKAWRVAGSGDGGGIERIAMGVAVAAAVPAAVGGLLLIGVIGAVVAVVVLPFSMFLGLLPQSIPPHGLLGPPAPYWSALQAAQAQYHVPVIGLMALAQMTSHYQPGYTAPDGNAGIIAMPPSLFVSTAARHSISLQPACVSAAEKVNKCLPETTAQEMAQPNVEILVAAAALSDSHFATMSGSMLVPGKVSTAIAPFMCGTDPTCDTTAFTQQLFQTMAVYYHWLSTSSPGSGPAGGGFFSVTPNGDAWNQTFVRAFPLPASTSSDPFPYAQCTWWAYYNDPVAGVSGNAYEWPAEAAAAGDTVIPASYGPMTGEVVVFAPGGGYSRRYGHVAYVVAVHTNAAGAINGYEVSEANVGIGGADVNTQGVLADIPWPDPHVLAFLPPTGQWRSPLSSFQQKGA